VRTLEEREAAYAEARLRILGSAVSTDEELVEDSCDHRSVSFHYMFLSAVFVIHSSFILELVWDSKSELLEIVGAGF